MLQHDRIPAWLFPPFILGVTLALGGAYWDDATHTEKGRDSFLIPPHIALYAGVTLAGAALVAWALLFARRNGMRAILGQKALVLALLSVAVTLGAGPVDNAWHLAFGRDAVLWSPPHVLGAIGSAAVALSILVELVRSEASWAIWLRPLAGGLVLAPFAVLVFEYDTDVPQFDAIWYLPVLTLASSIGLALVRVVDGRRCAATGAAAVHLVLLGGISAFLALKGFDTPKLPLLVVPALALDLGCRWGLARPALALLYSGALYLAYVPLINFTGHGVRLDTADVALGFPLALASSTAAFAFILPRRSERRLARPAVVAALCLALLQLSAGNALAHDPGQGKLAGSFDLAAEVRGHEARVVGRSHLDGPATPRRVVARRAGVEKTAPLRRRGQRLEGRLRLPQEGRWFVYLEVRHDGKAVESWLPVKVGEAQKRFVARRRFAYFAERHPATAVKWGAGAILYASVLAVLVAVVRLARSASAVRCVQTSSE